MSQEHDEIMDLVAEGDPLLQQALANSREQDQNCNVAKFTIEDLKRLATVYHEQIHPNLMVPCDEECAVPAFLKWLENDN